MIATLVTFLWYDVVTRATVTAIHHPPFRAGTAVTPARLFATACNFCADFVILVRSRIDVQSQWCACRGPSRTAAEPRLQASGFRRKLPREPEVRKPPGRSPPTPLQHPCRAVSSRLRGRRTRFFVFPGQGTAHRGIRPGLRGPPATVHYPTCGRWSHLRTLRRAPGPVPRPLKCRRARGLPHPRPVPTH